MAFTCSVCGLQFSRHNTMERHMRKHEVEYNTTFKCDECDKSYTTKYNLVRHHSTTHGSPSSPPPKYNCAECGKSYNMRCNLVRHLREHDPDSEESSSPSPPPKYECADCLRSFDTRSSLVRHLKYHNDTGPLVSDERITSKDQLNAPADCSNVAQTPNVEYVDLDSFVEMEPESPPPLDMDTLQRDLEDPLPVDCFIMTQGTPKVECDPLPSDCYNMTEIKKETKYSPVPDDYLHIPEVKEEIIYDVVSDDSFNVNQSTPERASKPYTCSLCGFQFTHRNNLTRHMRVQHAIGDKPKFTCPDCNRSFSRKFHLLRHLSSHSKSSSCRCTVCGKLYSRKESLDRHVKCKHDSGSSSSPPPKCTDCGNIFSRWDNVLRHMKECHGTGPRLNTLSPSKPQPLISTPSSESLSSLDQCPSSQAPKYHCAICGNSYIWRKSLVRHMRTSHSPHSSSSTLSQPTPSTSDQFSPHPHPVSAAAIESSSSSLPQPTPSTSGQCPTHLPPASEAPKHQCQTCGKSYIWWKGLVEHVRYGRCALGTQLPTSTRLSESSSSSE